MIECEECSKTLGIFEGYRHPTLGKKHYLCSPCFDQVNESVSRWGEFVLSNSFNNGKANYNVNDSVFSFLNLNKQNSFQQKLTDFLYNNVIIQYLNFNRGKKYEKQI